MFGDDGKESIVIQRKIKVKIILVNACFNVSKFRLPI
jgi:hypothetical protein